MTDRHNASPWGHWGAQYVGLPYALSAADIGDGFNCWSFFLHVQAQHYGRALSVEQDAELQSPWDRRRIVRNRAHYERWMPAAVPQDGGAVVMGRRRYASHIGVWVDVDGGKVLHALEGVGVVASSLLQVKELWRNVEFFSYVG